MNNTNELLNLKYNLSQRNKVEKQKTLGLYFRDGKFVKFPTYMKTIP